MKVAGIDVHKKVLMAVVVDASKPEEKPARRRFATMPSELQLLERERDSIAPIISEGSLGCFP